jgi:6-phosphogluconate dehydrogenase
MQIGMVGIGRMGANLVRRLLLGGHDVVAYDVDAEAVDKIAAEGAIGTHTIAEFANELSTPRVAWIMVPAALTGQTIRDVAYHLQPGDIIIDGGNSMWQDSVDRANELARRGIHFVDIGTSGGVFGLERGFSLMIGGRDEVIEHLNPVFATIAPGIDSAPRTGGRTGAPEPGEQGWLHCGGHGAGHFVKMVHNGVEYGMMAAIAEGLAILDAADAGTETRQADAETTPLRDPQYYRYDFDTSAVAEVWRRGSVVSSWLVDLTAHALSKDPALGKFEGRVSDSGEGRWTAQAAVDLGVPAHTITASLFERFASRGNDEFANKVLSAMRSEFGGHNEKSAGQGSTPAVDASKRPAAKSTGNTNVATLAATPTSGAKAGGSTSSTNAKTGGGKQDRPAAAAASTSSQPAAGGSATNGSKAGS